ncbi:MAG: phenylacetate--CoA ligase family protein [Firmicutes bacterium]|nr:phenylacetate--CoA ligase family protein [Bacillota bacterium]
MDILKFGIEHALYPYMEKRKGNQIRFFTKQLQESEKLPAEQLRATQEKKLKELLLHCADNVPAYQDLDKAQIEADPFAALQSIPALDKKTFREDPDAYVALNVPAASLIPNKSGGSTGSPVHFFMDRQQVEQYEAARWRGLSWYGITNGSRSVMVWGSSIELSPEARKAHDREDKWLKNREVMSAYELNEADGQKYIDYLNSYKPEYLYGYSTALTAFAKAIEKAGKEKLKIRLKAIVTTSETLFPWQAEYLNKVFDCPIGNEYGARDAGILAYSCPCGGMHITAENAILEVLDPKTLQPLPEGSDGILAITDLTNRVQPRLRYMVGDTGTLLPGKCSCGRTLPLMKAPEGREDALLVAEGGRLVHGNFANQIIRDYPQVSGFQLIQHTPDTATLKLAGDPAVIPADAIVSLISANLPGVSIQTEFVDAIAPAPSGKIRYSIREFDL